MSRERASFRLLCPLDSIFWLITSRQSQWTGAGALWVSFVNSGVFRLNHGMWSRFGSVAELPQVPAIIELTDSAGRIWFGYTANRIALLDSTRVSIFA